ncbi:MAG: asparagine synthase (glutamine-hydrolyzing) [Chitinophagaceae bacterium]|nr:asparagine synthase (glutamine-hydrolyzing) [Chitinophagaceae bacterium]
MCGIAGIISHYPGRFEDTTVRSMIGAISHRGPDGESFWVDRDRTVFLAHRRLAILDLSDNACQPMNYLDRYSIVHNGEIYNYLELKETLSAKGYRFSSGSDTEVILAAFDLYRTDCLQHFDGMFAFAIWDDKEKVLFAARDRFGEKPFYYSFDRDDRVLYFGSELKALWAAGIGKQMDESMMLAYLTLGTTSHPNNPRKTFYKSCYKLPPASFFTYEPFAEKELEIKEYWSLSRETKPVKNTQTAIDQFAELFNKSVSMRMRSDVTVGTSLSGGLDSSSIVASIHQQNIGFTNYKQQAFTASFPGFDKDETEKARLVASHFDLKQHFTHPHAASFGDELQLLIDHHEEPISSASVYAQYKVFELARRQHVRVLLDGQGADEILGGYKKHIHWYLQELLGSGQLKDFSKQKNMLRQNRIPFEWQAGNYLAALMPGKASKQLQKRTFNNILNNPDLNDNYLRNFYRHEISYKPVIKSFNDILHYNTTQSGLEELLRYADKNSMAHGCEVRLPFLQHELVEYIFSLPPTFKINEGYTKWILRKSMEQRLPREIVWRKDKTGFEPPQLKWMQTPAVVELINQAKEKLVQYRILNKSVLTKKIQPHSSYAADSRDWRYLSAGLLYY